MIGEEVRASIYEFGGHTIQFISSCESRNISYWWILLFALILLYFIATRRHLGFVDATCKLIFYYSWPFSNWEIGVLTLSTIKNLYNFCVVLYIHSSSVFTSQLAFVDSANLRSCNTVVFIVKNICKFTLAVYTCDVHGSPVMFIGHLYFYQYDILHVWYFKK